MVDRVATGARNVVLRMFRSLDVGLRQVLRMTAQAGIQRLLRLHQRKCARDRGLAAARRDVLLCRSMAAFAARLVRRLLARCDALEVRILVEIHPDVGMAGFTDVTADKSGPRGGRHRLILCSGRQRHQQQQQYAHLHSRSISNTARQRCSRFKCSPNDSEGHPSSNRVWRRIYVSSTLAARHGPDLVWAIAAPAKIKVIHALGGKA